MTPIEGGYAPILMQLAAPDDVGYEASIQPYPNDPAQAKKLIQ